MRTEKRQIREDQNDGCGREKKEDFRKLLVNQTSCLGETPLCRKHGARWESV